MTTQTPNTDRYSCTLQIHITDGMTQGITATTLRRSTPSTAWTTPGRTRPLNKLSKKQMSSLKVTPSLTDICHILRFVIVGQLILSIQLRKLMLKVLKPSWSPV